MKIYLMDENDNTAPGCDLMVEGVYSHGELEHLVRYDHVCINSFDNFDSDTSRVEAVTAVMPNGTSFPAILYFWTDDVRGDQHGLVCMANDIDAQQSALRKYLLRTAIV